MTSQCSFPNGGCNVVARLMSGKIASGRKNYLQLEATINTMGTYVHAYLTDNIIHTYSLWQWPL